MTEMLKDREGKSLLQYRAILGNSMFYNDHVQ